MFPLLAPGPFQIVFQKLPSPPTPTPPKKKNLSSCTVQDIAELAITLSHPCTHRQPEPLPPATQGSPQAQLFIRNVPTCFLGHCPFEYIEMEW